MSRVYTIKVAEKVRRVVHLEDRVKSGLDVLDVLPPEGMKRVLARELQRRGFAIDGSVARRVEDHGVVIEVDLDSSEVTISLERQSEIEAEDTAQGRTKNARDAQLKTKLEDELKGRLEDEIDREEQKQQNELTGQLERALADVQAELDQIGNRATAEALKEKAASMGEVTSIEEEEDGALTIRVKV